MQLKSGTFLQGGKYKIIRHLGQGSFGITYLAEHTALGKRVCIKEFFMKELNLRSEDGSITGLSEGTLSYNYASKFRKEAMNLAGMEHPNIVRVTDSFDENGTFYYVMDYIEGQNLNEYIKDHALSESEAISIIKDVANALMYMHEQKHMLHLDLKPGNIMRRASDGHVFLIDFGLSKHYDKNGTPETSTTIGGGTSGYAPTEQGDKAKDGEFRPTIDVYALGATLFKLLTRETPPTASEVVNDDEILAEKLSNRGVSQNVINLVVKAMMPGYKKRISSIRDFFNVLLNCNVQVNNANSYNRDDDEETVFTSSTNTPPNAKGYCESVYNSSDNIDNEETATTDKSRNIWLWGILCTVIIAVLFTAFNANYKNKSVASPPQSKTQNISSQTFTVNGVSFDMMVVEGGTFEMGSNEKDSIFFDASPVHSVTLGSFLIGKYEVTQELWQAVMGNNPSYDSEFFGDEMIRQPVNQVSWNDCQAFISKINSITGKHFRLPTEAEWEFAARGGINCKGFTYSGSNNIDDVAMFNGNANDVGLKKPNELGIYDMSGNVSEWCNDWYGYYDATSQDNPTGPETGEERVFRGGDWGMVYINHRDEVCHPAVRYSLPPDDGGAITVGFRLALSY